MQLKYMINGVGIYIEEDGDKSWNAIITDWLEKELDASLSEMDERAIQQKLFIKPYSSLLHNKTTCPRLVTPNYSVLQDGIFISLVLKIALKSEKDYSILWVDKENLADVLDAFLLPFVLQMLFLQRNMAFIHSIGIVVNDKAILLPALPGMHKTAFISAAMRVEGVKMLGDELVLIDKDGYLYPYPGHCWLTAEHKPFFPEYFENNKVVFSTELKLNLGERIFRRFRYVLYNLKLLGKLDNKPYSIWVPPSLLFSRDKIVHERIVIDKVYVLRKWRGIDEIRCTMIEDTAMIANFCVSTLAFEMYVMQKLNYNMLTQKGENISKYFGFAEHVIQDGLNRSNSKYYVDIPETWNASDVVRGILSLVVKPN